MTQILLSFIRLTELVISISRGLAGARRVKAVLETETTMPDPANSLPQKAAVPSICRCI